MIQPSDFYADVRSVEARLRLLLHCLACEVEWRGAGPCWSCGRRGRLGSLPYQLVGATR